MAAAGDTAKVVLIDMDYKATILQRLRLNHTSAIPERDFDCRPSSGGLGSGRPEGPGPAAESPPMIISDPTGAI
jgi:hypothetical protein